MWQPLRLVGISMNPNYEPFPFFKVKLYSISNIDYILEPSSLALSRCAYSLHRNGNGIPILQLEADSDGPGSVVTVSTSSYS